MRKLYEQSLMVLAASEDKRDRGASIASPNMPWVWGTLTLANTETSGPYHLVWPRDFYHVATAQKAAGDDAAATRLARLPVARPEGGRLVVAEHARGRDGVLDQPAARRGRAAGRARVVARPPRRRRLGATSSAAADFIVANGPKTEQERWENQERLVAEHDRDGDRRAGLRRRHRAGNGDAGEADAYEAIADEWQAKVEGWTATTNGPYSAEAVLPARHEGRQPGRGTTYELGDNFPRAGRPARDRRQLVPRARAVRRQAVGRPGRAQLARGRRRAARRRHAQRADLAPLHVRRLRRDRHRRRLGHLPDRRAARRAAARGRCWPASAASTSCSPAATPTAHLRTIARTANDGLMLPEQVWDGAPPEDERAGEGTRSATPLAWTHAQFVRLAWSIAAGEPVERPAIVACRYTGEGC